MYAPSVVCFQFVHTQIFLFIELLKREGKPVYGIDSLRGGKKIGATKLFWSSCLLWLIARGICDFTWLVLSVNGHWDSRYNDVLVAMSVELNVFQWEVEIIDSTFSLFAWASSSFSTVEQSLANPVANLNFVESADSLQWAFDMKCSLLPKKLLVSQSFNLKNMIFFSKVLTAQQRTQKLKVVIFRSP